MNRPSPGGSPATTLPPRITLKAKKGFWHYRPVDFPYAEPVDFPRLPFAQVHRCGSWLSQIWKHYRRVGCVLLYWDAKHPSWETHLPPQMISERSFLCDLSFAGFERPSPDLLLCGSFTSDSTDDGNEVMDSVPPFDGLHIVQHVQHEVLAISAFYRSGEHLHNSESSEWMEPVKARTGSAGRNGSALPGRSSFTSHAFAPITTKGEIIESAE